MVAISCTVQAVLLRLVEFAVIDLGWLGPIFQCIGKLIVMGFGCLIPGDIVHGIAFGYLGILTDGEFGSLVTGDAIHNSC